MTPLNPDELRVSQPLLPASKRRPPRHRKGERFLKGPIPWKWLQKAMALPGRALHVGVGLWFQAGMKKSRTVAFPLSKLPGVTRWSARRGLGVLKTAGLVSVEILPGRAPRVTILEVPDHDHEQDSSDTQRGQKRRT